MADLKHITITFCDPNGDGIMNFDINDTIPAIIPNVGDKVHVVAEGRYREVSERVFNFLENIETIAVQIYLKE